ncbi:NUDIX hydrolase [Ampullimonas aquatilis]|uniref:NUDIX hydrolase n=1 Tax=Ampullimonas aquatilis TaxID=1341549 RepID=UPI003C7484C5
MLFCSCCGHRVKLLIPDGDNRPRHVCPNCKEIHYLNPKNVVGTIPTWSNEVLLCKRAIEPRYGYWTLPAGFMEVGETMEEGALRETLEEAGARVRLEGLYSLIDVPHVHQVHFFYRARLIDTNFMAGEESLEVRLFKESEIPWDNLAFSTVKQTLRHYFSEQASESFTLLSGCSPQQST